MFTYKEIGSEYWLNPQETIPKNRCKFSPNLLGFYGDSHLLLSGRTAIDFICEDIQSEKRIESVYMPSYCCESMLEPFLNRGIKIFFYDVTIRNKQIIYDIDLTKDVSVLYFVNYFGYENTLPLNIVRHFRKKSKITIYDRTHSIYCLDDDYVEECDYSFASIRKWFPIPTGAIVSKTRGHFVSRLLKKSPLYVKSKIEGMTRKYNYMLFDENENKQLFLSKYDEFNQALKRDYCQYAIDEKSQDILELLDYSSIAQKRLDNAQFLIDNIKNDKVDIVSFGELRNAPLFVPILLLEEHRNLLRCQLIKEAIYCPQHWPQSKYVCVNSDTQKFYESELSLVCDQRYTIDDMKRIVNIINTL